MPTPTPTRNSQSPSAPTSWSTDDFPTAMVDLPSGVRDRAILAANELAAAGHDDRAAIRLGIARAWDHEPSEDGPNEPMPGPARLVYPERGEWIVETVGIGKDGRFREFEDALRRATHMSERDGGRAFAFVDQMRTQRVVSHTTDQTRRPTAFHVRPWRDGWALARLNASDSVFDTFEVKADAISKARDAAREASSRLVIHRSDGSVQTTHDYRTS